MSDKTKKNEATPVGSPKLRIVDAEELATTTANSQARHRSALVQQFMSYADQLDQEIAALLKL